MLTERDLYRYQLRAIKHILDHEQAMLWIGMGLGKTIVMLIALQYLLDRFKVYGALIVAPLRVCQLVWRQEARKWSPTSRMSFSLIHGTATERETALRRRAEIYLINYENLVWLTAKVKQFWLSKGRHPPFDLLVLDEVTKVKNSQAKRTKALEALLPVFKRRIGLTGEPAANGYVDLHGQFLCVDGGERLGRTVTSFRERFLRPSGWNQYEWTATRTGRKEIHKRIADITLQMNAEDYLDLPPVTYNVITVVLPKKARKVYDLLEKEFFAELDSGQEVQVLNEAGKLNKLLQIASGAAYFDPAGSWEEIHTVKLDALDEVLGEAGGRPVLCGYTFRHEATRVAARWPRKPEEGAAFLSAGMPERDVKETLARWFEGKVPLLCGHPASMGHGLTLSGGDPACTTVVWLSCPWSLELYKQLNARVIGGHRLRAPGTVHHIIAKDTVDELVYDTLQAKHQTQEGLKQAIARYRERRGL